MELLIASNNQKKLRELKKILAGKFEPVSLKEKDIESDPEETGTTFEENSLIKAMSAMQKSGIPSLADDSGLYVYALNGEPGVYSARYSGENATDEKNNALLLKNMNGVTDRRAKFISVITLVYPDGRKLSAKGECEGLLLDSPQGENGFGYDPLFFLPLYGKTMAEIDPDLKNTISHRAAALKKFVKLLEEN